MSGEVERWWESKVSRKKIKGKKALNEALPDQLMLFELLDPNSDKYSQGIDLFDSLPWVVWSRKRSYAINASGNKFLDDYKKEFQISGKKATITIPAVQVLDHKTKNFVDRYPGQKEWMVEKALRKLACSGEAYFEEDKMTLSFRFNQLMNILKEMKVNLYTHQLLEALQILGSSKIHIRGEGVDFYSSIIDFQKVEDLKKGDDYYMVSFSKLISQQILNKSYRLYNNKKLGSIGESGGSLAQWLYLKISMRYIQASETDGYNIHLISIMRDSPMGVSQKRNALEDLIRAVSALKDNNVISRYEIEKMLKGQTLEDAKITIYASSEFVADMKKSNFRKKIVNGTLEIGWKDDGGVIEGNDLKRLISKSRQEAKIIWVDLESKNSRFDLSKTPL